MADLFKAGSLYDPTKDPYYADLVSPKKDDFNFISSYNDAYSNVLNQERQDLANSAAKRKQDQEQAMIDALANAGDGADIESIVTKAAIEGGDVDTILKMQQYKDQNEERDLRIDERRREKNKADIISEAILSGDKNISMEDRLMEAATKAGDVDMLYKLENVRQSRDLQREKLTAQRDERVRAAQRKAEADVTNNRIKKLQEAEIKRKQNIESDDNQNANVCISCEA